MRILFVNNGIHHKNHDAIRKYKNIEWVETQSIETLANLNTFDCVFCPSAPSSPIDVSKYPNTFFIFGPHFSVFPDNKISLIKGDNAVYNALSQWNTNGWKRFDIASGLKIVTIPFGVDTRTFNEIIPINQRHSVFVYYKHRSPKDLAHIGQFLQKQNIQYEFFNYSLRYDEAIYIRQLQHSRYGIWVDAHESQGFALQEALSCNVPLLVWSVTSMNQEYGSSYDDIPATTVPYWDDRCGEVFYKEEDLEAAFSRFMTKLGQDAYRPRDYVIENLSIEMCELKLIDEIFQYSI